MRAHRLRRAALCGRPRRLSRLARFRESRFIAEPPPGRAKIARGSALAHAGSCSTGADDWDANWALGITQALAVDGATRYPSVRCWVPLASLALCPCTLCMLSCARSALAWGVLAIASEFAALAWLSSLAFFASDSLVGGSSAVVDVRIKECSSWRSAAIDVFLLGALGLRVGQRILEMQCRAVEGATLMRLRFVIA